MFAQAKENRIYAVYAKGLLSPLVTLDPGRIMELVICHIAPPALTREKDQDSLSSVCALSGARRG